MVADFLSVVTAINPCKADLSFSLYALAHPKARACSFSHSRAYKKLLNQHDAIVIDDKRLSLELNLREKVTSESNELNFSP